VFSQYARATAQYLIEFSFCFKAALKKTNKKLKKQKEAAKSRMQRPVIQCQVANSGRYRHGQHAVVLLGVRAVLR
jgi:hypothetical protein